MSQVALPVLLSVSSYIISNLARVTASQLTPRAIGRFIQASPVSLNEPAVGLWCKRRCLQSCKADGTRLHFSSCIASKSAPGTHKIAKSFRVTMCFRECLATQACLTMAGLFYNFTEDVQAGGLSTSIVMNWHCHGCTSRLMLCALLAALHMGCSCWVALTVSMHAVW